MRVYASEPYTFEYFAECGVWVYVNACAVDITFWSGIRILVLRSVYVDLRCVRSCIIYSQELLKCGAL